MSKRESTAAERNVAGFPHLTSRSAEHGARRRALKAAELRAAMAKVYAPGFFCELIRRHNWPPNFTPADHTVGRLETLAAQVQLANRREAEALSGKGWGAGTIPMSNTPHWLRPGRMGSAAAKAVRHRPAAGCSDSDGAVGAEANTA